MKKIGLLFTTFTIMTPSADRRSMNYITPGKIRKTNLSDCIYNYLKSKAETYEKNDEFEKATKPVSLEIVEHFIDNRLYYNEIHGILKSGAYGNETEIINVDDNTRTHKKMKNEAEVMPFGFSIFFRNNSKVMILVTQTNSNFGILNTIKHIIDTAVRGAFPDDKLKVVFHSMVPYNYFNNLLNNFKIKSLNVITSGKHSTDESDAYSYEEEERIYKKFSTKGIDKQDFFAKIFYSRNHKMLNKEIKKIGLIADDEQVDNVKLVFNVNGKPKSVNFNSFYKLEINEDITEQVIKSSNQSYPNPDLLFKVINDEVYPYLLATNVIKPKSDAEEINSKMCKRFWVEETIGKDNKISSEVKQYERKDSDSI